MKHVSKIPELRFEFIMDTTVIFKNSGDISSNDKYGKSR